jgi:hypothetical protein
LKLFKGKGEPLTRIRVTPDNLRSLRKHWGNAAGDLERIHKNLKRAKRMVSRQDLRSVRKLNLHNRMERSITKARRLASQADDLCYRLEKIAARFEEADYPRKSSIDYPRFLDYNQNQSFLLEKDLLENIPLVAFGSQCLDPAISPQSELSWVTAPTITSYENLNEKDIEELNQHFGEDLLEIGESLLHGGFTILEIMAHKSGQIPSIGHAPVIIFFDSNGEPLVTSWLPDSMKSTMYGSIGIGQPRIGR